MVKATIADKRSASSHSATFFSNALSDPVLTIAMLLSTVLDQVLIQQVSNGEAAIAAITFNYLRTVPDFFTICFQPQCFLTTKTIVTNLRLLQRKQRSNARPSNLADARMSYDPCSQSPNSQNPSHQKPNLPLTRSNPKRMAV